ncbi:MAG TPA: DUF1376 domain-containing protein, partial [Verrucomicrobiae bacterium]|nr:DUF1376 domain-containing protein [Verrucomicrobiae bacterium]
YVLLIIHYWRTGGLPEDDAKLARIAKLSVKNWTELIKPDIQLLFLDGWKHKRIDKELAKQSIIATKRAMAGHKGGIISGSKRTTAKWHRESKQMPSKCFDGERNEDGTLATMLHNKATKKPGGSPGLSDCVHLSDAKQMPSKWEAVTTTYTSTLTPQCNSAAKEAAEEEALKPPHAITRAEYEAMRKRRGAHG